MARDQQRTNLPSVRTRYDILLVAHTVHDDSVPNIEQEASLVLAHGRRLLRVS